MRRSFAIALALTTVLAACGGSAAPSATPAPTPVLPTPVPVAPGPDDQVPGGLDGRTFLGTSSTGRVLVAGSQVRIEFKAGTLGASGGCNSLGGAYRIVDGTIVADQLMTTEMACDRPLMDQDAWLAELLSGATFVLDGNTLTLTKGSVTLTLTDRAVADPDRPLEGTRWIVDGLVSSQSVSSVPAGAVASLRITGGAVDVETGCNTGSGGVEVGETSITFGPVATTKMACDPARMELERFVLSVLAGEVGYTIEAGTLTLTGAAGGLTLTAED